MVKLTYASMKKHLTAIHDCGSNGSILKNMPEKDKCFVVIVVRRGTIVEITEAFTRGSSNDTRRETENRRSGRWKNLLDRDGNISLCNIWESIFLWSNNCLKKKK